MRISRTSSTGPGTSSSTSTARRRHSGRAATCGAIAARTRQGRLTEWSRTRASPSLDDAVQMPLPGRDELIATNSQDASPAVPAAREPGPTAGTGSRRDEEPVPRSREGVRQDPGQSAFDAGAAEVSAGDGDQERRMAHDLVGQPRVHDQGPRRRRDAGLHATARRPGEVRPGGPAHPPRMRQVGPQGQHRLPLQRRGGHAVQLPVLADLHLRQRPPDGRGKDPLPQGDEDPRRRDVQPPVPETPVAALREPLQPRLAQAGRDRHRLPRRGRGGRGLGLVRDERLLQRLPGLERRGWRLARGLLVLDGLSVEIHLVGRRHAGGDGHRRLQEAVLLEGGLLRDVPDAAGQRRTAASATSRRERPRSPPSP